MLNRPRLRRFVRWLRHPRREWRALVAMAYANGFGDGYKASERDRALREREAASRAEHEAVDAYHAQVRAYTVALAVAVNTGRLSYADATRQVRASRVS